MNITKYLEHVDKEAKEIFSKTIQDSASFGKAHFLSTCLFEFSQSIQDLNEQEMLRTVCSQLESGMINLAYGLYRQAFASLRLAFEMCLGAVHFSIHKMEHFEWIHGKADIKWAKLIDSENGVLSKRFANAFFPELSEIMPSYNDRAGKAYRELSEFVHGNSQTWLKSGIVLKYNDTLKGHYFSLLKEVGEIILIVISCRYLKYFKKEAFESMDFLATELNHIDPIREFLGGPKQIR
ncbi:hypothetical protein ACFQZS_14085 [Mucilaginibacter calamicampi]|uniref:AbiV family abortive infection protein n=1 Tax=Mucilaginibacter calamicampi TaxID=1302352 RepID=A0ABW2YZR4_9SPHI